MPEASTNKDIRGLPVNVGLLIGAVVSCAAALGAFVSAQSYLDSRIYDNVDSYANVKIYPRVVDLERSVKQIVTDQQKIAAMIETQDSTRNRQYGEMKKISEENNEKLQKVIDHLLVNK